MAIVSAVLRYLTHAPPMLAHLSSLTIGNGYLNTMVYRTVQLSMNPLGQGILVVRNSGQNVDTRGSAEVGYIAFVPLSSISAISGHDIVSIWSD